MRLIGGVGREDWLRSAGERPIRQALRGLPAEYGRWSPMLASARTPHQLRFPREAGVPIPDYITRRAAQYPRRYAGETVEPLPEDVAYAQRRKRADAMNRMINAGKDAHHQIKEEESQKARGYRDEDQRKGNPSQAKDEQVSVFVAVGIVGNDYLEYDSYQKSKVGENSDMGVLGDDESHAVKEGENYGDCQGCGIVYSMEYRG